MSPASWTPTGAPFLTGLLLGLSMILPIGPQNVFVLSQGLLGGVRRGLLAAATAGVCDTLLILTGAAGLSALLLALPWLKTALLALGALFLAYLGLDGLRGARSSAGPDAPLRTAAAAAAGGEAAAGGHGADGGEVLPLILTGVGVSWGNPHAILDTVAVLGSAIAARDAASRLPFAAGTVAASWLFFLLLALAGSFFRSRAAAGSQVWVRRVSALIMLVFALVLGREAVMELLR